MNLFINFALFAFETEKVLGINMLRFEHCMFTQTYESPIATDKMLNDHRWIAYMQNFA